jgi:hypothetical protein
MASEIDAATHRRLLRHEAEVHALPGRTLLDVGDALFLHDPVESEPFWNRMESIRWPTDAAAFDRRLAEAGIQFASIGRQPHIWLSPPFDEPADLHARLTASGFEDMGEGQLMVASGDASASRVLADRPPRPGTSLDRQRLADPGSIDNVYGGRLCLLRRQIEIWRGSPGTNRAYLYHSHNSVCLRGRIACAGDYF